jgi:hypothetical protein
MLHLPDCGELAIELLAKLTDQLALGPGEPLIIE